MDELLQLTHAGTAYGGAPEFRGTCCAGGPDRAYGGHVVAQALLAAHRTVDPVRYVNSLHAYFLSMGRPGAEVQYRVRILRDGGTYALREVTAFQGGNALLSLTASFKKEELGPDRHTAMPHVPTPESIPAQSESVDRFWSGITSSAIRQAVQVRPISGDSADDDAADHGGGRYRRMWIRIAGEVSSDHGMHAAALAFCSDLTLARTAALGHLDLIGGGSPSQKLFLTSLDHAVWFHRPCRTDEWLLFVQRSPTSGDGRGLSSGEFWTRTGVLVATVTQEVLIREKHAPTIDTRPTLAATMQAG
ncbi:acyl-CoA thioesterase [Rhodococcus erythropolis]|uniref:acyl-CoA thioesterase n=1 Tax=Rhodococcus erythropolis TaxID=1833 RepID=UPI001BEB401F|nr:acyl-CoA thioesterase domain-containing protein [Rhodococcus erythropolis]MBT2263539.1 thioesterase family protein [Rhodococcus erythropolis]